MEQGQAGPYVTRVRDQVGRLEKWLSQRKLTESGVSDIHISVLQARRFPRRALSKICRFGANSPISVVGLFYR